MKKLCLYEDNLVNFYLNNKNNFGEEYILFDSPKVNDLSEYSYLLADFSTKISFKNGKIFENAKEIKIEYFEKLRKILSDIPKVYESKDFFTGGLIGLVSYDYNRYLEKIADFALDDLDLPQLYFVVPRLIVIKDEKTEELYEVNFSDNDYKWNTENNSYEIDIENRELSWDDLNKFEVNIGKDDFVKIAQKAKEYIKEGDIFQVNLSQRFASEIEEGESLLLYRILRKINPSPFASFVHLNEFKLISQSPERLVRLKDGIADTRPIAGTRRLIKGDEQRNLKLEIELQNDSKECAEHIMLVDLERNDLGKISEFGTVEVDELMVVERYSHVMHLVSNVKGQIRKEYDAFDLLKAMFPGGTITGAPKIRSMEIIEELEPTRRGFYTGSLGFVGYNGNMDFNIIIRSFVEKLNKVYFQVGAGIVYDSIPEREYKETINKARAMVLAYENLKRYRKTKKIKN